MLERWPYGGWWENIFSPSFRASFVCDLTSHHLQLMQVSPTTNSHSSSAT